MKRTIEMEDDMDERIDGIKEEMVNHFIDYLKDNPDIDDFDEYYQDEACDFIHESVDTSTPIYTKNIDDLYYLYGSECEEAYRNAGIGNGQEENHQQVAIYCYLEQKAFDFLRELEDVYNDYIDEGVEEVIKELEALL